MTTLLPLLLALFQSVETLRPSDARFQEHWARHNQSHSQLYSPTKLETPVVLSVQPHADATQSDDLDAEMDSRHQESDERIGHPPSEKLNQSLGKDGKSDLFGIHHWLAIHSPPNRDRHQVTGAHASQVKASPQALSSTSLPGFN